ncbi:uncharacterized protein E0L32_008028 [Thyridium curvatum]|uniref:GRIP domain-containing protein n=1 Tax=Thyridium curvatum TaxID=1093900 RepID=A0A507B1Q1_9PEZI|nr:uncharacterized protein E0L32_008028 [Thyridium curvatum]TPX10991.1 hypothetical protein E0L32_008028 [Thyridium curvatum]
MSSGAPADVAQSASQALLHLSLYTGSKKKNNKKKKGNKPKAVETDKDTTTTTTTAQAETEEQSDVPETPVTDGPKEEEAAASKPESPAKDDANSNGHASKGAANGEPVKSSSSSSDTSAKLEAMSQEREALRSEVEQLRKQLESIQEKHNAETTQLKSDLEESEAAKEQAEEQYQNLLGRVKEIRETLGERLKRDRQELEEAKDRIDELESQNEELAKGSQAYEADISRLKEELRESNGELTTLRSRSNLSQQNWVKERDDMVRQMQHLKNELESTSNAMGEWEVIAMEERSVRESLQDKVGDLEEQLASAREAFERAASERDTQSQAIDGLQRALQDIQDARKKELREMVESSEEQLEAMKKRVQEADSKAAEAESAKDALVKELERTAPFEKEVKEKNLLIGKLRHEAIVLNDHLTKALKYIKKNRPEENVDRAVVTNLFLQFLGLDRSDPKKFQVLQVIAGMLNWTEEQKEQAGLARPGTASHSSLRLPSSPFHRTPSTPSLNTEFFSEPTPTSSTKESLSDLWAGFLERSVEEAAAETAAAASRKGSDASLAMGPPPPGGGAGGGRPDTRG